MHAQKENLNIEEIVQKYSDMVYRLAVSRTRNKEDAEDVFQEVFLKLSKSKPNFESEEHIKFWLIRVTINSSINLLKSSWMNKITDLKENIKFENEEKHEIYYEVLKLPQKERTIIHLFYYESLKISEIAKMMKISESGVKSRLCRAREKLRKTIQGGIEDE